MNIGNVTIAANASAAEVDRATDEIADALLEMRATCSLDVADRDGATLEEVGIGVRLTRERIRQLQKKAERSMRDAAKRRGLLRDLRGDD